MNMYRTCVRMGNDKPRGRAAVYLQFYGKTSKIIVFGDEAGVASQFIWFNP